MEDNKKEISPEESIDEKVNADTQEETSEEKTESEEKLSRAEKKALVKLEKELIEEKKKLEGAMSELAAANDKYARLYAEFDNYKKRTQKEKDGIYSDAYGDAICQMLPIIDNFERALQFRGEQDADDNMARGLELIYKSFTESLAKMGVCEIAALGEKFDPERHNAVMHVEDESFGENEVVEVLMKGYARGDKVLRYAMVKVAN